jgi:hypothetical protein
VLGALGLPFLILGLAAATSPAIATSLLFVTVLGLSLTLVSATRREPGFRPAIVIAAAGLLGAVVYALGAFGAF